jgi:PhnB protein
MGNAGGISRRRFVEGALSAAAVAALPIKGAAETSGSALEQNAKGDAMTTLTPYLLFDGNCRQAMEFYKSCFGGEMHAMSVKDSPAKDHMPAFQQEKTINARLRSGAIEISASDWLRPDEARVRGNTVCLYLSNGTFDELKTLFARLSEGADVTDPLKEQFYGMYGALNDRFGVRWMFQANKGS